MAAKPSPMNAGDGEHSYAKNLSFQKNSLDASKDAIEEVITESLDVEKQLIIKIDAAGGSSLSLIRIADLGCSSGPNTFYYYTRELRQDQLGTFNSPNPYPSVKQMRRLVEKNGYFTIEKMELRNPHGKIKLDRGNLETGLVHARAAMEGTFTNQFGNETANEMFERAIQQTEKVSNLLQFYKVEDSLELFAVLKCK